MKKTLSGLFLITLMVLTASVAFAAKYEWRLAHGLPEGHAFSVIGQEFADLLKEKSDGQINLTIYPNMTLYNERAGFEAAQMGTLEFALATTSVVTNFDPAFAALDLPFLFDDAEHAYRVMDSDHFQAKLKGLEKVGIIGLGYWELGWPNFVTNKVPIRKPSDLKGLNIRTMEAETPMTFMVATGANPVPMPFSEIFTALENGTIEGLWVPTTNIYFNKLHTIADYISMANCCYFAAPLAMSAEIYNSLPADIQQIVVESANEVLDRERAYNHESGQGMVEAMRKDNPNGIIEYTPEMISEWQTFVRAEVYPKLVGTLVSQEDLDVVQSLSNKK